MSESQEHGGGATFSVIVNGRPKSVTSRELSFTDVVKLAYPTPPTGDNIVFTITFRNADGEPHEGNLIDGQKVHIKKKDTIFNVTATDKS